MSDNKKYYYMKVKETFFDSEEMKLLESQVNGIKYQNLYLKLCLLSLKSNGALLFKDVFPYDIAMLSTVLRVDIDTVKTGIEIFQKMKLVDIVDNGTIFMSDIQSLIGKGSTEAERMVEYRKKIKGVQTCIDRTPELEKDIELDIEKKLKLDSELEKNSDKENSSSLEEKKEYPETKKEYLPEFLKAYSEIEKQGKFSAQLYRKNSTEIPVSNGLTVQEMMLSLLKGTFIEDWFVNVSEKQKNKVDALKNMTWDRIVSICNNPKLMPYEYNPSLKDFLVNLHNPKQVNFSHFLSWVSSDFTDNTHQNAVTVPSNLQSSIDILKKCKKFHVKDEKKLIQNLSAIDDWVEQEYSWIEEFNHGKNKSYYDSVEDIVYNIVGIVNKWEKCENFNESFFDMGSNGWNMYVRRCSDEGVILMLGDQMKKSIQADRDAKEATRKMRERNALREEAGLPLSPIPVAGGKLPYEIENERLAAIKAEKKQAELDERKRKEEAMRERIKNGGSII